MKLTSSLLIGIVLIAFTSAGSIYLLSKSEIDNYFLFSRGLILHFRKNVIFSLYFQDELHLSYDLSLVSHIVCIHTYLLGELNSIHHIQCNSSPKYIGLLLHNISGINFLEFYSIASSFL